MKFVCIFEFNLHSRSMRITEHQTRQIWESQLRFEPRAFERDHLNYKCCLLLSSVAAHHRRWILAPCDQQSSKALRVLAGGDYIDEKKAVPRRKDINGFEGKSTCSSTLTPNETVR